MRSWIGVVGITILLTVGGTIWFREGRTAGQAISSPTSPAPAAESGVLGVDAFMKNVDNYRGMAQIEGVVGVRYIERQMFTLIDRQEVEKCGTVSCSTLILPVRWSGPLPGIGQIVRVKGRIDESGGKLVFTAHALEAMRP